MSGQLGVGHFRPLTDQVQEVMGEDMLQTGRPVGREGLGEMKMGREGGGEMGLGEWGEGWCILWSEEGFLVEKTKCCSSLQQVFPAAQISKQSPPFRSEYQPSLSIPPRPSSKDQLHA